jgi:hypothetical protein
LSIIANTFVADIDFAMPSGECGVNRAGVAAADDDMVFVRLRRAIEVWLRKLAETNDISSQERYYSTRSLIEALVRAEVLPPPIAKALQELIKAGNAQAHGQAIPPSLAEYARLEGPGIVSTLERLVENSAGKALINAIARRAAAAGASYQIEPEHSFRDQLWFRTCSSETR